MYCIISFNDRGIVTIVGPGLIEMFGLEMATELAPYKGFSMFMTYFTVPILQMLLSGFIPYIGMLIIFIVFTLFAVILAHQFMTKIKYIPFQQRLKMMDLGSTSKPNYSFIMKL